VLDRGRFTRLDFPGSLSSQALDINDRGQVVGEYKDADGVFHGYVWERGRFRTIDVPGRATTSASGINNRGQIVGLSSSDPADPTTIRGFLLAKGAKGPFTTISRPGATVTVPFDINNRGQLVGVAGNPEAQASPPPADTAPMGRMA
jgi:probable HAF family extracellular repeat protein